MKRGPREEFDIVAIAGVNPAIDFSRSTMGCAHSSPTGFEGRFTSHMDPMDSIDSEPIEGITQQTNSTGRCVL